MTAKDKQNPARKAMDADDKREAKRQSPDHPVGTVNPAEDIDYYERQRRESPDGMTAQERDAHQKASPGALNQTAPDGEKLGEGFDEASRPTEQSKG